MDCHVCLFFGFRKDEEEAAMAILRVSALHLFIGEKMCLYHDDTKMRQSAVMELPGENIER